MSEDQKKFLQMFLSEHWDLWINHCVQHGEDPDDVYVNALGGEPD